MSISILVSTYNHPQWLHKVLVGYQQQSYKDFEILIADDGSTNDTKEVVDYFKENSELDIQHLYQEDSGFRKCKILNEAITQAKYDYILISDGDCVPHKQFVAVHKQQQKKGYFLSGSYCKLPLLTSRAITDETIASGQCFDIAWLKRNEFKTSKAHLKLIQNPKYQKLMNLLTPATCNLKGANSSFWKSDALKINGFNEDMAWGGEDREFGVRLKNIGVKPKHVRYNAICLHLYHDRPYKCKDTVSNNKKIRIESEKNHLVYTHNGIMKENV